MLTFTYGCLPTKEQFDAAFEEEMGGKLYRISHGTESKGRERARAGSFTCSELWSEVQRLVASDTEESLSWACDILGTLGFEWI